MKKISKIIFILLLVCFSFFYTDKVINLINKKTPLMMQLNNIKDDYEIMPVNATIEDNTIIPGLKGREVDINKSYEEMKLGRIFREEALVFKDLYPSSTLANNKDKYIIKGNANKNKVSLLVIFNTNNIEKIKKIDNITIFINHKHVTVANINKLKDKEIYTYGNSGIYTDEILTSDNAIINRISNNKSLYCLAKEKDSNILETCNSNNMYVVIPNIIGDYKEIKNNLSGGSIILLNSLNNIDNNIKYIKSRGYQIVTLSNLLEE